MFCNLNYSVDKISISKYFYTNFSKTQHHKTEDSEIKFWRKLFDIGEVADPILLDLGLTDLDVIPRLSFQPMHTRLNDHIDTDRIVGININLMPKVATIHLNGIPYDYECCLVDVGTILHSVEPVPHNRLILKLAFREPWAVLYNRLRPEFILDGSMDKYVSVLDKNHEQFVKL